MKRKEFTDFRGLKYRKINTLYSDIQEKTKECKMSSRKKPSVYDLY